jgi:NAD(P)H-flavin reductase
VETSAELYYAEELQPAAGNYIPCLSQPSKSQPYFEGRVTDYLRRHLPPVSYDFYLCGRREMIRDVTLLVDERFEGSFIYTETFY